MLNIKSILSLLFLTAAINLFSQVIHHDINVQLNIEERSIAVVDSVLIPEEIVKDKSSISFSLNKNLIPELLDASFNMLKMPSNNPNAYYYSYTIQFANKETESLLIPLKYSGMIAEEVTTGANEYARGFSSTDGIISDAGVYLAGSSYWIPTFSESLLTFDLSVALKKDWNVVSQGERSKNVVEGDERTVTYQAADPTEEVYLIAAAWTEYEKKAGDVLVQAFLRTPDSALASRYIDATSGYLDMYIELVGPYPFSKFALVENFWETGFGMPSFTLLGEKIIRFPWILFTSYPHELLHNWWGNSVYVDFGKGNWCEGLTAYMADHLLKEQAGQGAEYRRTTLQKYTDYVNAENDFPVIEFRSRNNSAEEAIGYGKCLMFNHMLRRSVGDEKYINAYRSFYKENIFRVATFDDIQASFQKISGEDQKDFFDQWLMKKGAPELKLSDVVVEEPEGEFELQFSLMQVQEETLFFLKVPVAIYFKDTVELVEVVSEAKSATYTYRFADQPLRIEVDPGFDVFRRLDKGETPPTLSQVFGSPDGLIILPQNSPFMHEYALLAESWKQVNEAQGKTLELKWDTELEQLPSDMSAWILGFENKFAAEFNVQKDYKQVFTDEQTLLLDSLLVNGSVVYTIPNPRNNAHTIGFIGSNVKPAVPGLTRLLSHYGKYSFLGFEGERPNNVLKGNFPALNSPLFFDIPYKGEIVETQAVLAPAQALID